MKIYLDNCCFCRPFDEQGYDSIAFGLVNGGVK
jgi:hypothetical protein